MSTLESMINHILATRDVAENSSSPRHLNAILRLLTRMLVGLALVHLVTQTLCLVQAIYFW